MFVDNPLDADRLAFYQASARKSHEQKARMEADDKMSFEDFLGAYYE